MSLRGLGTLVYTALLTILDILKEQLNSLLETKRELLLEQFWTEFVQTVFHSEFHSDRLTVTCRNAVGAISH